MADGWDNIGEAHDFGALEDNPPKWAVLIPIVHAVALLGAFIYWLAS